MSIYVGLDCGTQSLNALALQMEDGERSVRVQVSLPFDDAFPGYGTRNGVFVDADPLVVTSSPLMWAEALDTILGMLAGALGPEATRVAAISGSGQQHGSVYLRAGAEVALGALDPGRPLADQLGGIFAVDRSPVWMDASTGAQCASITRAVGGPEALAYRTGSRAFERFTGPQVRKLHQTDPAAYADTRRVHLVSSYLASLLLGADAPMDTGDASGMNLMDLREGRWWDDALEATAPELRQRLPSLVPPDTVVGRLSPYWQARHGLPPARVVAWTGDNPSSLVGLGLVRPGITAISLGTSDTVFTVMPEPGIDPAGSAHVFGAPTGDFMSLVCFRNGSLARERVRDRFGLDWEAFSEALRGTPPGNRGSLLLPWFEPEITPPVSRPALHAEGLDPDDSAAWVRACVEGQMLAAKRHSAWAAPSVERIHVTGGAARNVDILQVIADVFDAPVFRIEVANAACLGAALRAAHADLKKRGPSRGWQDIVEGFVDPGVGGAILPRPEAVGAYGEAAARHAELERRALAVL